MAALGPELVSRIDEILEAADGEGRQVLHEHEVYRILAAVGLEVPRFLFVRDPSAVSEQALRGLGTPIVAKIVSPGVMHKQRVGGVKVIATPEPLYVEFVLSRMREEVLGHFPPDARPEVAGYLLVEHVAHTQALGYEVLLGFREDAAFGPVLTVSKGGDDAEFFAAHYDPANLFLPPVEYEDALAFTRSLHIRHKLEQIGHPEYLSFMARAMERFSALALACSSMQERRRLVLQTLEVNPFVISSDGRFVALDGLAELAPAAGLAAQGSRVDLRGSRASSARAVWPWSASRAMPPGTAWPATSPSSSTSSGPTTSTWSTPGAARRSWAAGSTRFTRTSPPCRGRSSWWCTPRRPRLRQTSCDRWRAAPCAR